MNCKHVPIQPTFEMIKAGAAVLERLDDCPMDEERYRARGQAMHVFMDMVEAAPNDAADMLTADAQEPLADATELAVSEYTGRKKDADAQQVAVPQRLLETTQNLARYMARNFYPESPQFEVLDSVGGVISQIDNMVTGLQRAAPQPPQRETMTDDTDWQRLALDAMHAMQRNRIWGGMAWHYNPIQPVHFVDIMRKIEAAAQGMGGKQT